jgi:hypothetical protein
MSTDVILECQEKIAELPNLNFLYGKRHLRKLRLKRLESYKDKFLDEITLNEKQMIEEVEKEILEVRAKIEDITFECDKAIESIRRNSNG